MNILRYKSDEPPRRTCYGHCCGYLQGRVIEGIYYKDITN